MLVTGTTQAAPVDVQGSYELALAAGTYDITITYVGYKALTFPGIVIGAGHTQPAGQAHAEIQALRDAAARGNDVRGATAYVTLEPCSHHGRTPPCSNALIEAGLGRVVAAMVDPNPLVAGRGLAQLEASHFVDNPASGRVLEKLGFAATGLSAPRYSCARGGEASSCAATSSGAAPRSLRARAARSCSSSRSAAARS